MSAPEDTGEPERRHFVVDILGVKLPVRTKDTGEEPPKSWREVLKRINQYLMNSVSGIFGLLSETIEGSRRIVCGLGDLPTAIASRAAGARRSVDKSEDTKIELVDEKRWRLPNGRTPQNQLVRALQHYKQKGLHFSCEETNGKLMLCISKTEDAEAVKELAKKEDLPALTESVSTDTE